jgi:hypothetical protein
MEGVIKSVAANVEKLESRLRSEETIMASEIAAVKYRFSFCCELKRKVHAYPSLNAPC